jgi:hypothetical protein
VYIIKRFYCISFFVIIFCKLICRAIFNKDNFVMFTELGANLAGQENVEQGPVDNPGSSPGLSTVNSVKSQKTLDSFPNSKFRHDYLEQLTELRTENTRYVS